VGVRPSTLRGYRAAGRMQHADPLPLPASDRPPWAEATMRARFAA
jgi:hypothetical protein